MMLRSMYTTLLPHIGHMDIRAGCTVLHSRHEVDTLLQHGLFVIYINRIAIQ